MSISIQKIVKYSIRRRGPPFTKARAQSLMLHAVGDPLHQEEQTSVELLRFTI